MLLRTTITAHRGDCWSKGRRERWSSSVHGTVQKGKGLNSGHGTIRSCCSPVLLNNSVCSRSHCPDVRELQGCDPGIVWKRVKEDNLEQDADVGKEGLQMIQEFSGKLVAQRASLPTLSSLLLRGLAKMTK